MDVCKDCALRLFNDKGHNLQGVGNIWSGNAIVLPNVDYDAYKKQDMSFSSQVDVLCNHFPTGGLVANCYIVPLIRCREFNEIVINGDIIKRCLYYLMSDIKRYKIKNIMFCGDAARRYLNIDDIKPYLDTVICHNATRTRCFVNYSPLVKYTNDNLYKEFESHLIKYYNSIVTRMYDYDIMFV